MTERERLIEKLNSEIGHKLPLYADGLADFIINERKRICGPLVKFKKDMGDDAYDWKFRRLVPTKYIDQTLKLAGLEDGNG